jgi:tetratricopeptide (TPR) repeat protein
MKKWLLPLIMFCAAGVRWVFLAQIWRTPVMTVPIIDSEYYQQWAANIAAGRGGGEGIFFMSPLLPYLLSLLYRITTVLPQVGLLLQSGMGIAVVYLIYSIGKKVFNKKIGLTAAAMAAFYAPFVYYEGVLLTATVILLLNATILLMLLSNSPKRYHWLVIGLLLGLSALARPNVLIFSLLLGGYYFWRPPPIGRKAVILITLGLAMILVPVAYRNYHVGGEWVLTTAGAGMNFYAGNNPEAEGIYWEAPFIYSAEPMYENQDYRNEASSRVGHELNISESSRYWLGQGFLFIIQHPFRYLKLELVKLFLFFHAVEIPNNLSMYAVMDFSGLLRNLPLTFGLIAPIGFGFWLMNLKNNSLKLLNIYGLSYLLATLMFFAASEYRLPVLLLIIPFAAAGIWLLVDNFKANKYLSCIVFAVVVMFLAIATNLSTPITESLTSPRMDFFNLGSVLQKYNRDQDAVDMLQKSLLYDPQFVEAHRALGDSYHRLGMHEQAAEEFRRAGMDPQREFDLIDADQLIYEGQKAAATGDKNKALELFLKAINKHPEPPVSLYFNVAYLELQAADTTSASDHLQVAAEADPREARVPYLQAQILEAQGKVKPALDKYLAALDLNMNFDWARARAAAMAIKVGDKDQAAKLIEPILGLEMKDKELVDFISQVASQVGY